MPQIDIIQMRRELRPHINSLANLAYGAALEKFQAAKNELIIEFLEHPVTRELKDGPDAENYSGTLDGYGNLYSFIGFPAGEDPTEIVEEALQESITLQRRPRIIHNHTTAIFTFDVLLPTLNELGEVTPFPDSWTSGSWLIEIEHSIPNLRYYLYEKDREIERSRSGPAIQVKTAPRGQSSYSKTEYISRILGNFVKNVERLIV